MATKSKKRNTVSAGLPATAKSISRTAAKRGSLAKQTSISSPAKFQKASAERISIRATNLSGTDYRAVMFDRKTGNTFVLCGVEPRAGADVRQITWVRLRKAIETPGEFQLSDLYDFRWSASSESSLHPDIQQNAAEPRAFLMNQSTGEVLILAYPETARRPADKEHLGYHTSDPDKLIAESGLLEWLPFAEAGVTFNRKKANSYQFVLIVRHEAATNTDSDVWNQSRLAVLRMRVDNGWTELFEVPGHFPKAANRLVRPVAVLEQISLAKAGQSSSNSDPASWTLLAPQWFSEMRSREGRMTPAFANGLCALRAERNSGTVCSLQENSDGGWKWVMVSTADSNGPYNFFPPKTSRLSAKSYAPLVWRQKVESGEVQVLQFRMRAAQEVIDSTGAWLAATGARPKLMMHPDTKIETIPGMPGNSFGYGGLVMSISDGADKGVWVAEIQSLAENQKSLGWPIEFAWKKVPDSDTTMESVSRHQLQLADTHPNVFKGDQLVDLHTAILIHTTTSAKTQQTSYIAAPRAHDGRQTTLGFLSDSLECAAIDLGPVRLDQARNVVHYTLVPHTQLGLICLRVDRQTGEVWIADGADRSKCATTRHAWAHLQWYRIKRYDLAHIEPQTAAQFEFQALGPIGPSHNAPWFDNSSAGNADCKIKQTIAHGLSGFLVDQVSGRTWALNLQRVYAVRNAKNNADIAAGHRWLRSFELLEMDGWTFDVDYSVDGDWVADFANKSSESP